MNAPSVEFYFACEDLVRACVGPFESARAAIAHHEAVATLTQGAAVIVWVMRADTPGFEQVRAECDMQLTPAEDIAYAKTLM